MNNDIDRYSNYSLNNNEKIGLNNQEGTLPNFLRQLKRILTLNDTSETKDFDKDNYSILLTGLLLLVKNNNSYFSFEMSKDEKKILIKINKSIEYTDFQLFTTLFEELSLVNLHYLNEERVWRAEFLL